MRRQPWSGVRKVILTVLSLVILVASLVTWPWWYPWLIWRDSNTSWVTTGPGVDPLTYVVKDRTLAEASKIPKILHQTWKTEEIPPEWQSAQQSCIDMHPDYKYMLWTDTSSREFIAKEHPKLLKTWDSYPFNIQRADLIRYAVLQTYGGYYLDLDIVCLHPLDFLAKYPIVVPKTWPVGFSNDFIASEPNNPFMTELVDSAPRWRWHLVLKYPTVMFSTGPMFVTVKATLWNFRKDLWVLTDSMYNKYKKSDTALFSHLHGSSWHGEDAKSVLWIMHHPIFLAVLTLSVIVTGGALYWRRLQKRGNHWSLKGLSNKSSELTHLKTITIVKDS